MLIMIIHLAVFALCWLYSTTTYSNSQYEPHVFRNPFRGRYCPTKGVISPNLPWHHCKLFCLQTSRRQGVNYNFTSNICTYFTTPCPQAKHHPNMAFTHYNDVTMSAMVSQIASLGIVYSGGDQRKHQSPASLVFVRGIHQWPVCSPHKGPVTRKMFPFDDVSMPVLSDTIRTMPRMG